MISYKLLSWANILCFSHKDTAIISNGNNIILIISLRIDTFIDERIPLLFLNKFDLFVDMDY